MSDRARGHIGIGALSRQSFREQLGDRTWKSGIQNQILEFRIRSRLGSGQVRVCPGDLSAANEQQNQLEKREINGLWRDLCLCAIEDFGEAKAVEKSRRIKDLKGFRAGGWRKRWRAACVVLLPRMFRD